MVNLMTFWNKEDHSQHQIINQQLIEFYIAQNK